jgi:hypothetical protein
MRKLQGFIGKYLSFTGKLKDISNSVVPLFTTEYSEQQILVKDLVCSEPKLRIDHFWLSAKFFKHIIFEYDKTVKFGGIVREYTKRNGQTDYTIDIATMEELE